MRIAVTGRQGQLATSLVERAAPRDLTIILLGRPELDLAKPESVERAIRNAGADLVVNAAAYTEVDKAETEPEAAEAVNRIGAGAVAEAAARLKLPVIQISTDYVFDGSLGRPYRESDPTAPLGAYGRSKLGGEEAVAAANPDHAILRTAWVYSPFGKNFVKTMLRVAGAREEVSVVADQQGGPTSALDAADAILTVARNLVERPGDAALRGIFHMTGQGETNWAAFAEAIFAAARERGGPSARVKPITTAEYPTPARRPANSRLDCSKLQLAHGVALPDWHDSLQACVARLV